MTTEQRILLITNYLTTKSLTMNNFQKSSLKEREMLTKLFNQTGISDFTFTSEKGYDRHDAEFKVLDTEFIVEVKVRNVSSTAYPDTLVDDSKVQYLIAKAKELNAVPVLVIFFSDGTYASFNLNKHQGHLTKKYCNRTTAINTGKRFKEVRLFTLKGQIKVLS